MAENDKQEVDSKSSSDPKENTRSRIAMIYCMCLLWCYCCGIWNWSFLAVSK